MFRKKSSWLILLILIKSPILSYATCNTYIYNATAQQWRLQFSPSDGNVYFLNINPSQCPNSEIRHGEVVNGPCILNPNDLIEISYTTNDDTSAGLIYVTNTLNNNNPNLQLSFSNSGNAGCPNLENGYLQNTVVKVNYPNPGFFVIESNVGEK